GILVLGADGAISSANPAAQQMLGLSSVEEGFRLADSAPLTPIALAFEAWLEQPQGQRDAFVNVKPFSEVTRESRTAAWSGGRDLPSPPKPRFARVDRPGRAPKRFVVFMQDVTAIENQAQELKLASMGRLTASIAHEVRNPLSAIGHAQALLA